VTIVSRGEQALQTIQRGSPNLVLLDRLLPDLDGCEVCHRLRTSGHTELPVVLLTAKAMVADKIAGLECGADDYITKPFDFEELVARIQAALHRRQDQTRPNQRLQVADLTLDTAARQVWGRDRAIELTAREYNLLELLAVQAGQVLTKETIFERVWGDENEAGLDIIKVAINSLRSKLNTGGRPDLIQSVRGVGYLLRP
jgi:DNA-binding response OmpR family regulator